MLAPAPLLAQTVLADEPLRLKATPMLQEKIEAQDSKRLPTFVSGDRVTGRPDLETVIEGNAQLRRGGTLIRADRLEYYQPDDLARARGNVRINREGSVFEGTLLELKVESFEGSLLQPRYEFLKNRAHGDAERVDFVDDKRAVIRNATYTTCTRYPGPSWMPEWILRAASISIDTEENEGFARNAVLSFKGVPILPIPALSFPLTDARKSGFLPPAVGFDNQSGLDISVPYYWNIAPNRDATFFPAFMSKRGVDLGGEFRYLESAYQGVLRANLMPGDRLRDRGRWGLAFNHSGSLDSGFAVARDLQVNLSLNRVSDDNYWRDFPRATSSLTQRLLANDATMAWTQGPYSVNLRAIKWQTLQDAGSPITPPYDRMPQLALRYQQPGLGGFDVALTGDYTRFEADPALTLQPNAHRSFVQAQLSRTWGTPGWFLTPRVQLHATSYQFDAPLADGSRSASRVLPSLSLDAGMIFERDASYFGRRFRQTLEPRAFLVSTPFRDQSLLPNYDSAANDFNFATIYTENAFGGNDRISDSRLLTLGLSSRLIDPDSGIEAVRLGVAQRVRFKDQNVTLPGGAPVTDRISDLLLGASINWSPQWSIESTFQYNAKTRVSERSTVGARYSPGNYRVVSAAYRLQRNASEQIDLSWQWPLNDLWGDKGMDLGPGLGQGEGRWYSVGRINYSLRERKLVDSLIGFEYDAGCWIGRIVIERLQNSQSSVNKRVLFQLEFVGFSRLGANPLGTLRENIPRYQNLRERTTTPSRFGNYE
jgi:LPS-assembly protein